MSNDPRFQVRLHLTAAFAEVANQHGMGAEALKPLADILDRHNAKVETQLAKFAKAVEDVSEEDRKSAAGAFGRTIDIVYKDDEINRGKREKFSRIFVLDVDGEEILEETGQVKEMLDDLRKLEGGAIVSQVQIVPVAPFHGGMTRN